LKKIILLKNLQKILFLLIIFFPFNSNSQNFINENSVFECDKAFPISFPLQIKNDQTVFYQYEEQFSFWYKFNSQKDEPINFQLSSIDDNDRYTVFVYEYNEDDFCFAVFNQKIKPLKERLIDKKSNIIGLTTDFKLNPEKGKNYFFCILNTSEKNCGHHLKIDSKTEAITIKSIHIPCSIDEVKKNKPNNEIVSSQNALITNVNLIDKEHPKKHIKAEITIKRIEYNSEIKIDFDNSKTNSLTIEKDKLYTITCVAPGYKRFNHDIIVSDYMETDTSSFDIYLKPLKSGDKFLMNHVYFHPNTYALKTGATKEMNYLLNFLNNNPKLKIELAGHTNGNNKIKKNKAFKKRGLQWNFEGSSKKLSILRAEEIKQKLVKKGIDPGRINTKGYGGDKMIIKDAKTLEAIEKNIRVEITIH
jgi:outer membrane protein OmpA-like peptidoglycan-associated protein